MATFEGVCKVTNAGPCNDPNVMSISFRDPEAGPSDEEAFKNASSAAGLAGNELWLSAPPGKERECLAVAIAAITSKKKVWVGSKEIVNWGQLNALYLLDAPSE